MSKQFELKPAADYIAAFTKQFRHFGEQSYADNMYCTKSWATYDIPEEVEYDEDGLLDVTLGGPTLLLDEQKYRTNTGPDGDVNFATSLAGTPMAPLWEYAGHGKHYFEKGKFAVLETGELNSVVGDMEDPTSGIFATWKVQEGQMTAIFASSTKLKVIYALLGLDDDFDPEYKDVKLFFGE